MPSLIARLAVAAGLLAIAACGFRPLYATGTEDGSAPLSQRIAIREVQGPEVVTPFLTEALQNQIAVRPGESADYELVVVANERAEQLAVQIDATVTRYIYRLIGKYTLIDMADGRPLRGTVEAVASYNLVSSQYSTLFAERAAQEKAATVLAEKIERDILLRMQEKDDARRARDLGSRTLDLEVQQGTDLLTPKDETSVFDAGDAPIEIPRDN